MLYHLTVFVAILALTDASAIKGHNPMRPAEDARSIKLAPVNNNLDKSAKAPAVPILESSKKVYNDESIRRLVAQQPAPAVSAEPQSPFMAKSAEVVHKEAAPVAAPAPEVAPAPVSAPAQVAAPQSVVVPVIEPIVPVVPVVPVIVPVVQAAPVVSKPVEAVEAKSIPVEAPKAAKSAPGELPPQSERSVPVPSRVVVAESTVGQASQAQAEPAVPVAPVSQPESVVAKESSLQAKKDDAPAPSEPLHIEVPAPDPGLVLSEPIDSTTKLLIDLDEHVQKFLPAEDQQQPAQLAKDQQLVAGIDYSPVSPTGNEPSGKSNVPLAPYSGADEPIVPPLPSLDGVEKASASSGQAQASPSSASQAQSGSQSSGSPSSAARQGGQHQNQQQVITQLLDQLDSLQNRIQDTINQLVARRRYVMSALLRPMGTYVRRVRTNLERLQNRVNQLQAAAVSVGGGQNRPGGFVDAAAIETIRRRIDDISKRISDIVNRIRFSLTPTSAPLNSNGRK